MRPTGVSGTQLPPKPPPVRRRTPRGHRRRLRASPRRPPSPRGPTRKWVRPRTRPDATQRPAAAPRRALRSWRSRGGRLGGHCARGDRGGRLGGHCALGDRGGRLVGERRDGRPVGVDALPGRTRLGGGCRRRLLGQHLRASAVEGIGRRFRHLLAALLPRVGRGVEPAEHVEGVLGRLLLHVPLDRGEGLLEGLVNPRSREDAGGSGRLGERRVFSRSGIRRELGGRGGAVRRPQRVHGVAHPLGGDGHRVRRRPVTPRPCQRQIARLERRRDRSVRTQGESAHDEGSRGLGEGRTLAGRRHVEAVVLEGSLFLLLEEEREEALHLFERALGDRRVTHGAFDGEAGVGAPGQDGHEGEGRPRHQQQRRADPRHPAKR